VKLTDDRIQALLEAARADDPGSAIKGRVRAAVSARITAGPPPSSGSNGSGEAPPSSGSQRTGEAPPSGSQRTGGAPPSGSQGTGGTPPSGAPPPAPPPHPALVVSLGKAVIAALLTGVLGFAGGLALGRDPEPEGRPPASMSVPSSPPPAASGAASSAAAGAAAVPPESPAAAPSEAAGMHPAPLASGAARAPVEPRSTTAPPPIKGTARTAGAGTAGAGTAGTATMGAGAGGSGSGATDSSLAAELALLREVHGALRDGDAPRAERWIDEHAARFPDGVLREEREAARVLSLCAKGRTAEARAEADRFLAANPRSVQADRVRGSCAFAADGGAP
jgi:hypothetical protein